MNRVLVCGSRSCSDQDGVWKRLDALRPPPDLVITGGCGGVDTFAARWAEARGLPSMVFPAPWNGPAKNGAGPLRNGWMLTYGRPTLVVAFPGRTGTADMVAKAKRDGVPVLEVGLVK